MYCYGHATLDAHSKLLQAPVPFLHYLILNDQGEITNNIAFLVIDKSTLRLFIVKRDITAI